jgi:hypothetical protein
MCDLFSIRSLILFAAIGWAVSDGSAWIAGQGCRAGPPHLLRLSDGSFGSGRIVGCLPEGRLAWHNEGFEKPFLFSWDGIHSLTTLHRLNARTQLEATESDADTEQDFWQVELFGGMRLAGKIRFLDQTTLGIQSALLGNVDIQRKWVRSISRQDPRGQRLLKELKSIRWEGRGETNSKEDPKPEVRFPSGDGLVSAPLNFPNKFQLRMRLRLADPANFTITLLSDRGRWRAVRPKRDPAAVNDWIREAGRLKGIAAIEAWQGKLFFQCRNREAADMISLGPANHPESVIELSIWLDQANEKATFQILGQPVQELKFHASLQDQNFGEILVQNSGTDLIIDRLELWSWTGSHSDDWSPAKAKVSLRGGAVINGRIQQLDQGKREWVIETIDGLQRAGFDQVADGFLLAVPGQLTEADRQLRVESRGQTSPNESNKSEPAPTEGSSSGDDIIRLVLSDRSRLCGRFLPSSAPQLEFQSLGIQDVLKLETDWIEEIYRVDSQSPSASQVALLEQPVQQGVFITSDSCLKGNLPEAAPTEEKTIALHWQPVFSHQPSPVMQDASGRIVLEQDIADNEPLSSRIADRLKRPSQEIVLRSGDRIQTQVDRIDHLGVHFQAGNFPGGLAAHELVDRIIFQPQRPRQPVPQLQIDRLLTVPQRMADRPPTHLFVARTGDLLRGNLSGLSQNVVTAETRGNPVQLPLDGIAEIVWLSQATPDLESAPRIRITLRDGQRLTLDSFRSDSGRLSGASRVWGDLDIDVEEVLQLEFGQAFETETVYSLRPAAPPRSQGPEPAPTPK